MIAAVIGIALLVATGSRFATRRWFEHANQWSHRRSAAGIILGAESIELAGAGDAAVLLLHGFGDTPQTLRPVADRLHALGYSVSAPLLPGHGRSLAEFVRTSAPDWTEEARAALNALSGRHPKVGIVGLSMGGALAAILASERRDIVALILLSPYVSMPRSIRRLVRWRRVVDWIVPYFPGLGERSIQDERAAEESLAYGALNASVLAELAIVVDQAARALPRIELPVLMIQSREDNRIPEKAAARVFERIGSFRKRLVWISGSGHVITVDRERERVLTEISLWMEGMLPSGVLREER